MGSLPSSPTLGTWIEIREKSTGLIWPMTSSPTLGTWIEILQRGWFWIGRDLGRYRGEMAVDEKRWDQAMTAIGRPLRGGRGLKYPHKHNVMIFHFVVPYAGDVD